MATATDYRVVAEPTSSQAGNRPHENHETVFMDIRTSTAAHPGILGTGVKSGATFSKTTQETFMEWQTPKACDFRFGFEITMYIAAR